ncbi:MAG: leucine-rich repeat domain-containing protein [Propionibacteriaceae bacterium]|nr:leucine-rich repeat domain-containing protein [Propionibacteriaceae bacterium]
MTGSIIRRVAAVAAGLVLAVGSALVPTQAQADVDIYVTDGQYTVNGRQWRTKCEPYSQTERCRTEIWGTTVTQVNGRFVQANGWQFNNLTYKASPRSLWKGNFVGGNGEVRFNKEWKAKDGRKWRTECDTATTGWGGCRAYIEASVIAKVGSGFQWRKQWVLNNMVRFSADPAPKPTPTPQPPKTLEEAISRIPDAGLRACLTKELIAVRKETRVTGPATPWHLDCSDGGVVSLAGLNAFPQLVTLDLWWNEISSLATLPTMPQLKGIDLSDNALTSLAGIERFQTLEFVGANNLQLTDISMLSKLPKLQGAELNYNQISDLSPLSGLTSLEYLDIGANPALKSLTPIAKLPLTELRIDQTGTKDLLVLAQMKTLQFLNAELNPLASLAPLAGLENLEVLQIDDTAVADLAPIAGLPLTELRIQRTKVTKVAPIAGMTTLEELWVGPTAGQITDLAALDPLVAKGLKIVK